MRPCWFHTNVSIAWNFGLSILRTTCILVYMIAKSVVRSANCLWHYRKIATQSIINYPIFVDIVINHLRLPIIALVVIRWHCTGWLRLPTPICYASCAVFPQIVRRHLKSFLKLCDDAWTTGQARATTLWLYHGITMVMPWLHHGCAMALVWWMVRLPSSCQNFWQHPVRHPAMVMGVREPSYPPPSERNENIQSR